MAAKASKSKNVIFEDESPGSSGNEDFSESKPSTIENIISVILGLAVVFVIGAMIVNVIRNRNNPVTTTPEEQKEDQLAATISAMYTVEAGDTLWSIAEKHYNDGFKYTEIEKANNMNQDSNLEKGMQLIIPKIEGVVAVSPTMTGAPTSVPSSTTAPTSTVQPTVTTRPSGTGVPTATSAPTATAMPTLATISQGPTGPTGVQPTPQGQTSSASTDREYTVVQGDSLWDISVKRYGNGYRWSEIARMNNLKNPNIIHPGNKLLMP